MEGLLDSLSLLRMLFAADPKIVRAIEREIKQANDWVEEKMNEHRDEDRPARTFGDVASSEPPIPTSRSIFDDVDG
jgi:hypothetical protein